MFRGNGFWSAVRARGGAAAAAGTVLLAAAAALGYGWWKSGAGEPVERMDQVAEARLESGEGGAAGTSAVQRGSGKGGVVVDVKGAVRNPGVYVLPQGARVREAVEAAGGVSEGADLSGINLAAKVEDGALIRIPERRKVEQAGAGRGGGSTAGPGDGERVHLNSGTAEEIDRLPGIGKSKAEAIVKFRETQGPFQTVDQLRNVPGIGPKLIDRIRDKVDLQ
ncbi:MAG: ComEA family DNA-binding protein [Alicyclobacillaceae bacterium]|nr:ComEA family DNA-binding protein [Alicyclobacillaceae bacterium]